MKLHTTHANIERGGVHTESTFTIKTTAKAFDILSSGLYTDPITAIIRELSCNAYDAHIAAGKSDVPFEIHLPNRMEPFFSVTDFGIGLSDEQIQGEVVPVMVEDDSGELIQATNDDGDLVFSRGGGLYTTYFDSTKSDSNDYIGALGLGSKSPFSYARAFDVVSCFNGTKYIYSIFLNEDGIPSVALMGENDTDQSNGLEVRIAVEEDDFYNFETKTSSVLRYFPVKPKVVGALYFSFIKLPNQRLEGDGWFVSEKGYHHDAFTAVQGNVPYRVNTNQLRDDLDNDERAFLNKASIVAYFNIGDLDVAANREEIRYDARTKKALIEKMRQIRKDLTAEIEKKADDYKDSFWTACLELNTLSKTLFGNESSVRTFAHKAATKNKVLKKYIEQHGDVTFDHLRGHELVRYSAQSSWRTRQRTKRTQIHSTITPSNIIILYNDVKTRGIGRIKKHLHENAGNALVILPLKNHTGEEPFDGNDAEYKRLVEQLGHPEIKLVSEVTDPLSVGTGKRTLPFYQYSSVYNASNHHYNSNYKVSWDKLDGNDMDLSVGGLYFFLKNTSNITMNGGTDEEQRIGWEPKTVEPAFNHMIEIINEHAGTKFTFDELYGVSLSSHRKLKKEGNWFNIFDMFKAAMPYYEDGIKHQSNMSTTPNPLGVKDLVEDSAFVQHVFDLDSTSSFRKAIMPMIESHQKFGELNKAAKFIAAFDNDYGDRLYVDLGTEFLEDTAFKEYPMLTFVGSLQADGDWQVLFDYIKLIDRS